MSAVRHAVPPMLATLTLAAAPVLAADRVASPSLPERLAFGLVLAGGLAFFVWVAWLAFRR